MAENNKTKLIINITSAFLIASVAFFIGRATNNGKVIITKTEYIESPAENIEIREIPIDSSTNDSLPIENELEVLNKEPTEVETSQDPLSDELITLEPIPKEESPSDNTKAVESQKDNTGLININTASKKDLESLPGIGDVLSNRIIEYRQKNGKFASISDIKKVEGIGTKRYEAISDLITV